MAALPIERPRYVCFYGTTLRGAAEKSALLQMMEAREVCSCDALQFSCACHWVCGLIGPALFWFVLCQALLALCPISCTVTL